MLKGFSRYVRETQALIVQDFITGLVHRQSVAADLSFYDSSDFYDRLHRAREEASYRPALLLESSGSLLQNAVTLIAMAAVILRFGYWALAVLVIGTMPALYVVLHTAVLRYQWRLRATADERRARYYDWLLTTRDTAAEVRLFALGDHFLMLFRSLRSKFRGEQLQLTKQESWAEFWAALFGLVSSAIAIAWMGWKAVRGLVSLGDLAMFYQAFQQGLGLMNALLSNVGQIYASSLFLGGLFEFLALQSEIADPASSLPVPSLRPIEIRFRNVSFHYPGTQTAALDNVNLTIPAGSIAAIVGPNGAGKSTLVNLLCRFYNPDSGSIELDGTDLRRFSVEELRRSISVLFQRPVHYNATARENIAPRNDRNASPEAVVAAAASGAADEIIAGFPRAYEQLLGTWFENGIELSIGEWRRIALARAFLRRAPLLILDEPTGSMDPWVEAAWLKRFRNVASESSVLIITHRFTTARLADQIHVLCNGRIIESGSHQQLMALDGHYAEGNRS
jgi:ATP-binding cassette subfamily B protein